jgi:DNA repair exonuclease SbcCD ATPase subunit
MKKKELLSKLSYLTNDIEELMNVINGETEEELEHEIESEKISQLNDRIEDLENEIDEINEENADLEWKNQQLEESIDDLKEEVLEHEQGKKMIPEHIVNWFHSPFVSDFDKQRVLSLINPK